MKPLLMLGLFAALCVPVHAQPAASSAAMAKAPATLSGEVLEVKDVEVYTYLRLKTRDGETWAAISRAPVKVGSKVTIEYTMTAASIDVKDAGKKAPEKKPAEKAPAKK